MHAVARHGAGIEGEGLLDPCVGVERVGLLGDVVGGGQQHERGARRR
jgi:hypothetical protein